MHKYRANIKPSDVELTTIRKLLSQFLGIKEQPEKDDKFKDSGFNTVKTTPGAIEAWEKAGMPNPDKFFKNYKGGNNGE